MKKLKMFKILSYFCIMIVVNHVYSLNIAFIAGQAQPPTDLVYSCIQENDGTLDNCKNAFTESNLIVEPWGIAINNNFAYISDKITGEVYYCQIKGMSLNNCQVTLSGKAQSVQLLATANNNIYLVGLVNNGFETYLSTCPINQNGSIKQSNCYTFPSSLGAYGEMAIDGNILYYGFKNQSFNSCLLAQTGNCKSTDFNPNLNNLYGLAINNNYAYMSNLLNKYPQIKSCKINNRLFVNCQTLVTGFENQVVPTGILSNSGYLYMTFDQESQNFYPAEVLVCKEGENGTISNCKMTGIYNPVNIPWTTSIAFINE